MLWENLREEEFEAAIKTSGGLCVLPIGCLEKHGQHLPVGTDYFEAMHIVKAASKIEEVTVFPVGAWLGEVSCFHSVDDPAKARLRGCIGIKQETLLTVLSELCDEIARNGYRKILLVNGHGGNTALLKHFIRSATYEKKQYATMMTSAFAFGDIDPRRLYNTVMGQRDKFDFLTRDDLETLKRFSISGTGGGHADIRETALIMDYDKELVATDRYDAECGKSTGRADYLSEIGVECANSWLANYPNSYAASAPHGASERIGAVMTRICAKRLANIFKILKADEECVAIARMEHLKEVENG